MVILSSGGEINEDMPWLRESIDVSCLRLEVIVIEGKGVSNGE